MYVCTYVPGVGVPLVQCVSVPGVGVSLVQCMYVPGVGVSLVQCVYVPGVGVSLVQCVYVPGVGVSLVQCVYVPGVGVPLVQCITDSCGSRAVAMCVGELESARRVLQERMDMCDSEKVGAGGVANRRGVSIDNTFVQDKIKSENTALEEKLKCALLGSKDLEQEKKKLQEEVSKIKVHCND